MSNRRFVVGLIYPRQASECIVGFERGDTGAWVRYHGRRREYINRPWRPLYIYRLNWTHAFTTSVVLTKSVTGIATVLTDCTE